MLGSSDSGRFTTYKRSALNRRSHSCSSKGREIDFYAPSTLTLQGAQALGDAFNRRYKLEIKFHYNPSGSMGKDIGKVITRAAATIAPKWNLMMTTDAHHASLWLRKSHQPFNYAQLGVSQNLIHYDSGTVSVPNQLVLLRL